MKTSKESIILGSLSIFSPTHPSKIASNYLSKSLIIDFFYYVSIIKTL